MLRRRASMPLAARGKKAPVVACRRGWWPARLTPGEVGGARRGGGRWATTARRIVVAMERKGGKELVVHAARGRDKVEEVFFP